MPIKKSLNIAKHFIPFYFLFKFFTDKSSGLMSDFIKNERGLLRAFGGLPGVYLALSLLMAMPIPIITAYQFVLYISVLPELVDIVIKQLIRGISWIKTRNNDQIINKTFPQKYKPYSNGNSEEDRATNQAMHKLYSRKQEIKSNPKNIIGLSDTQEDECKKINVSVAALRYKPISLFITPDKYKDIKSLESLNWHEKDPETYRQQTYRDEPKDFNIGEVLARGLLLP